MQSGYMFKEILHIFGMKVNVIVSDLKVLTTTQILNILHFVYRLENIMLQIILQRTCQTRNFLGIVRRGDTDHNTVV